MTRILITSGPTREYLDPVRFLSNASSGRMGAALAEAVLKRGGVPVVVTGPVNISYPKEAEIFHVETTQEMLETCLKLFPECDGVIGAAAPCDYRPAIFSTQKLKKQKNAGAFNLVLVETPDILASLGKMKRANQWMVGFALETEQGREHALEKQSQKNCDFIVLNDPTSIDNESTQLQIFDVTGTLRASLTGKKNEIAGALIELVMPTLTAPSAKNQQVC